MDVVALTQFGVPGVCATLGTALTAEQAKLLKRFAPAVYLSYDGDSAGQHAILRGLDILEAEGLPARVLDFPDGLDPDEFIRRDGKEAFDQLPALTPASYRMRRLRAEHDLSTQEGRTEYAKACSAILSKLEPVERENHLQELMVQTGFSRDVLLQQIGLSIPAGHQQAPTPVVPTRMSPRRDSPAATQEARDEELLISLLSTNRIPWDLVTQEDFSDPLLRDIFSQLASGISPASLVEMQGDEIVRARVSRILLTPPSEDLDQLIEMARQCISRNRLKRLQEELVTLTRSMSTLTGEAKSAALQRAQQLSAEIRKHTAPR